MRNDNLTPEEVAEDRDRFYIYTDFEEQLEMLTHEQIGRAFLALYHYFHTGEKQVQEQEVNMMLSFMTSKLDRDTRYYARKVEERRQRASNAGKASVAARRKRAALAQMYEQLYEAEGIEPDIGEFSTDVNTSALNQPDKEKEKENDNDKENEKERERDREEDKLLSSSSTRSRRGSGVTGICEGRYTLYGEERIPATEADIAQAETLTEELYRSYLQKVPSPYDYEAVFRQVYTRVTAEDGSAYAAFSQEKADLLRHVFRTAAKQHNVTWGYMEGILANYEKYGVKTAEGAIQHEGKWKRGEVT